MCVINLGPSSNWFVTDCRNWTVPLPFTITKKAKETHTEEEGSIDADFYKGVAPSEPH